MSGTSGKRKWRCPNCGTLILIDQATEDPFACESCLDGSKAPSGSGDEDAETKLTARELGHRLAILAGVLLTTFCCCWLVYDQVKHRKSKVARETHLSEPSYSYPTVDGHSDSPFKAELDQNPIPVERQQVEIEEPEGPQITTLDSVPWKPITRFPGESSEREPIFTIGKTPLFTIRSTSTLVEWEVTPTAKHATNPNEFPAVVIIQLRTVRGEAVKKIEGTNPHPTYRGKVRFRAEPGTYYLGMTLGHLKSWRITLID